jgi:hypothetical protein
MSLRLVSAWAENTPVIHTAPDDLESFLWVLVWSLVHIFKDLGRITEESTINHLARVFGNYHDADVIVSKGITVELWPDKVFKGLIQEWLKTSADSRWFLQDFEHTLAHAKLRGNSDVHSQERECDRLEKHCEEVYTKFIQAGYSHLKHIRGYRDWKAVMDEDGEKLYR